VLRREICEQGRRATYRIRWIGDAECCPRMSAGTLECDVIAARPECAVDDALDPGAIQRDECVRTDGIRGIM
jgi:hypothetical protein